MSSLYLRGRPALAPILLRSARPAVRRLPQRALLLRLSSTTTPPTPSSVPPQTAAAAATVTAAATAPASTPPSATTTPPPPPPPPPAPTAVPSPGSTDSLPISRFRAAMFAASIGLSLFVLYIYGTDTRASFHRYAVPRLLRLFFPDAEDAHHIGTQALKVLRRLGLNPRDRTETHASDGGLLSVSVFDQPLANPVGISAGLDKDADIPDALFDLGAAVVEVGGCTPRPQAGNPKPRVFRVPSVDGMVNRYGLNSIGADAMAARLRARLRAYCREAGVTEEDVLGGGGSSSGAKTGVPAVPPGSLRPGRLLLVQVAKNKDTDEHDVGAVAADYAYCVERLAPYADVLVVNVSSPNTPGLRDLQAVEPLTKILAAVVDTARQSSSDKPSSAAAGLGPVARKTPPQVMVKVSPDEDEDSQIDGICEAVFASGVDGIIVGNTTKRRTGLVPPSQKLEAKEQQALAETGGFSGPAMFDRTLALVKRYRTRLDEEALRGGPTGVTQTRQEGQSSSNDTQVAAPAVEVAAPKPKPKTLFASGGLTNGTQALQLLDAGASVVMLYTGLVYGGAGTVTRIKTEMKDKVTAGKK